MSTDRGGPRNGRPFITDRSVTDSPVDRLFVWLAVDRASGNEGIAARMTPEGWMPIVTSKRDLAEQFEADMEDVSGDSGRLMRLVEYRRGEVISEVDGGGGG